MSKLIDMLKMMVEYAPQPLRNILLCTAYSIFWKRLLDDVRSIDVDDFGLSSEG
jgi:hypothetical protein